ncbi:MAG: trypsin-like serine protease [Candidatus Moranbacteria bacterium]|nr:trypsin-like serine protease [Candidatus Moranbacteria bacterium]
MQKKVNRSLSTAIIVSLFISMVVGSSFGFLVSLATTKNLKIGVEEQILEGDFSRANQEKIKELQQKQKADLDKEEAVVIEAVEQASPAVVSIIISKDVPIIERYWANPFEEFEEFEEFFGPFAVPRQRQNGTEKREIGGGSGFVISEDGYIITNKHVVQDESAEYTVLTNDEKLFTAKIMGKDPVNDVAVLKIDPKNPDKGEPIDKMPFLNLGDSDQLMIGQTVIAIGNSLGEFRNTVSKGIVSGLRRNIMAGDGMGMTENLAELIQTDAALNQGNSGGPLLNLDGKVVGVNVAMAYGAENVSFALPVNAIKPVIDSIEEQGRIVRPFLGIRYQINNKLIAEKNNLPYEYGALVQRGRNPEDLAVVPGSPADKAGIRENDLILEIEGKKITEKFLPSAAIANKKPGDKVIIKIWSKGEEKELQVELAER